MTACFDLGKLLLALKIWSCAQKVKGILPSKALAAKFRAPNENEV